MQGCCVQLTAANNQRHPVFYSLPTYELKGKSAAPLRSHMKEQHVRAPLRVQRLRLERLKAFQSEWIQVKKQSLDETTEKCFFVAVVVV